MCINFIYLSTCNVFVAAQWWCLARLLPLMIGDKVPVGDIYWENYLTLLEILDYLMAPLISLDDIAYLATIIEQHHIKFKALYPNCSITPKFHNLIHYTEFISRYISLDKFLFCIMYMYFVCTISRCGPVRNFWSMRFESKHSYFKDIARRVKCFKNIPKTLATHHQLLMCYHLNSTNFFIEFDALTGPGK